MTNAEKYLKDNVDVEELIRQLYEVQCNNYNTNMISCKNFFNSEVTPTLTEEERVILRNIQLYTEQTITICRVGDSHLYINGGYGLIDFGQYNHLFQFIKERRRIRNSRTFERRIEMYCYFCGQSDYGEKPIYLEENKCEPLGELVVKETIIIEGQYCPKCR